MSFADSADEILAFLDAAFAADDAEAIDAAHEAAIAQDVKRGQQLPEHRAAMRASLTPAGVRAFEQDPRFAYFILPPPHRRLP